MTKTQKKNKRKDRIQFIKSSPILKIQFQHNYLPFFTNKVKLFNYEGNHENNRVNLSTCISFILIRYKLFHQIILQRVIKLIDFGLDRGQGACLQQCFCAAWCFIGFGKNTYIFIQTIDISDRDEKILNNSIYSYF